MPWHSPFNHANSTLNVYCDFKAEPGAAWTLVQSYSFWKKAKGLGKWYIQRQGLVTWFPSKSKPTKRLVRISSVTCRYAFHPRPVPFLASNLWISEKWCRLQRLLACLPWRLWHHENSHISIGPFVHALWIHKHSRQSVHWLHGFNKCFLDFYASNQKFSE